jgi:hypothetical protein
MELATRIELVTSSLPRKYSTTEPRELLSGKEWSGRRGSNSRLPPWKGGALPTELRPQKVIYIKWWRGMDSNHRRLTPADLQSAPFGHSGTTPLKWSCSQESNLRPTVYKTVALPAELEQPIHQYNIDGSEIYNVDDLRNQAFLSYKPKHFSMAIAAADATFKDFICP